ncbi:BTAD domain-containing putative transcriptional regulator [Amycolatopsis sp. NPDC021455]|uniref:AfsR/SARP family transcriptional regulator n=1 Tax=Amycolatopsis sp. NPDC021455 TaxID=3154901 RepID=UPI0033FD6888
MEIRVLGPIAVYEGDRAIPLGGPKPRTLLARLALAAGRVVSVEGIIEALWGPDAADRARASVHTYLSTLRRILLQGSGGEEVIVRGPGGYRLAPGAARTDLHVFETRAQEGQEAASAGRFADAAPLFGEALAQWRGAALEGAEGSWADSERSRLADQRLGVLEDWFAARLAVEGGAESVGELSALVAEHPLRERLRGHLMTALFLSGRQADALACFHKGREVLVDELGVEPGPELRAVHERILRGEIALPAEARGFPRPTAEPDAPPERTDFVPVPRQLPPDIADFTGRTAEVEQLMDQLVSDGVPAGLRVCVISGKPGSGKSTLAAHVAHRLRPWFDGGQLYVNLRGVQAVTADPGEVLTRFLRALGIADRAMPADLDSRVELYRTLLADRKVLIVLDDAADERQIRPLLPGGSTCAVVVTSRNRLAVLEGARHVDMQVLGEDEATELLGRLAGPERMAAQPAQALEIVRLCGFLPLAVRIAGARLAARPGWSLNSLAQRLRVQHRLLNELAIGDLEVRGSVTLSYVGLGEQERVTLRRLGWLGTGDFAHWLVSALLAESAERTEGIIENLVDAQLLDMVGAAGSGAVRYRLHDLVRAFARERADEEEDDTEVVAAAGRVAETALRLVERAGARIPSGTTHAGTPAHPADSAQVPGNAVETVLGDPAAWVDAELTTLVDLVERCAELDLVDVVTRLTTALASTLSAHNRFSEWWRTHSVAIEAARRAGDRASEARLLSGLGWLRSEQDRYDESVEFHEQALAAFIDTGDVEGEGLTRLELSLVQRDQGRLADALASLDAAMPALTRTGNQLYLARAVHSRGSILTELGELSAAVRACEDAVAAYRRLGDGWAEALALRSLSVAHRANGRLTEAAEYAEKALEHLKTFDNPTMVAYAAQSLAKVRIRQGLGASVRESLHDSLTARHEMQDGFGQALLLRTLGELELAEGELTEAHTYLVRSLEWWTALGVPLWQARTLRDLSTVLDGLGRTQEADNAWAKARVIFERHGSREAREPRRRYVAPSVAKRSAGRN